MSETERRTGYNAERILIDTSRILLPQFGAQGIYLSGAQVELLRNVVAYLGRDTTFVDEYHDCYYLRATVSDFDDIQAIVADLEDKLANNDNTIWGYSDRLLREQQDDSDINGTFVVELPVVPVGEVWKVEVASVYRAVNVNQYVRMQIAHGVGGVSIEDIMITALGRFFPSLVEMTLKAGDNVRMQYTGATIGETVITVQAGWKMKVPE